MEEGLNMMLKIRSCDYSAQKFTTKFGSSKRIHKEKREGEKKIPRLFYASFCVVGVVAARC